MDQASLAHYARVALSIGVNLKKGQNLRICGEPPHREFMLELAREAYRMGARFVKFDPSDSSLARIRLDEQGSEYLSYVPLYVERDLSSYIEEDWALLIVVGSENPNSLVGADPDRLAAVSSAADRASQVYRRKWMNNQFPWCLVPYPTEAWARQALGRDAQALWEALRPILRLDAADPLAAWREHVAILKARGAALNALSLRSLRFSGPGTDLRVGLSPASRWVGAEARLPDGRVFLPNMPTEEVFTTPDFRLTEGRVLCTRGVNILNTPVKGISLEFKRGKVVSYKADSGAAALGKLLEMDAQASYLGELALVDSLSPIGRSGLEFGSTLLDENAACHIALGSCYPDAIEGGEGLSDEDLLERGYNVSLIHCDLMIGSEEVDVLGLDASGREISIIKKGEFIRRS